MPGLSVLLPIYCRDVTPLVQALVQQAARWPGPVEILCFDDASDEATRRLNRPVAAWPGVIYRELPRNVGRSAIRNQLAAAARHPWLLLLDNNISLPQADFLARYAACLGTAPVVVGGTVYAKTAPAAPEQRLRWQHGRLREARPARVRQQQPYESFILKNVLLESAVFRRFGLDEALMHYGHEDSKLGWQLQQAGIAVHHVDNPVLHDGLECAAHFLEKAQQAARNLVYLYQTEGWGTGTRLLQTALWLWRLGLAGLYQAGFGLIYQRVQQALLSGTPDLRQLDALKLYWALQELQRLRIGKK
ncbi:glycosyltransferase family 2 protein [Hymenobacter sp. DG25A]|uniref:glycosyltransferase family 2 protein n=1 Tax=Hymenobacter sp. DG25A TaxID=1385663 RepID=UPI0006C869DF|nr:glycosyltransferase [Hymenobacter sp. DG25A]